MSGRDNAPDAPRLLSRLDCIARQIEHYLLDLDAVDEDNRQAGGDCRLQPNVCDPALHLDEFQGVSNETARIDPERIVELVGGNDKITFAPPATLRLKPIAGMADLFDSIENTLRELA